MHTEIIKRISDLKGVPQKAAISWKLSNCASDALICQGCDSRYAICTLCVTKDISGKRGSPMMGAKQARLFVHITDWTQISSHDFEIRVLPNVILGHLKHAQMQIGDWTERSASHKHYGCLLRVLEDSGETVMRERIALGVCKRLCEMDGHRRKRGWRGNSRVK